jgi:hypothetical protein
MPPSRLLLLLYDDGYDGFVVQRNLIGQWRDPVELSCDFRLDLAVDTRLPTLEYTTNV